MDPAADVVAMPSRRNDGTVAQRPGWRVIGDGQAITNTPEPFDPAEHTVAQVLEHLRGAGLVERARVLDAERAGKARTSLLGD